MIVIDGGVEEVVIIIHHEITRYLWSLGWCGLSYDGSIVMTRTDKNGTHYRRTEKRKGEVDGGLASV
jgi:hypothetical protein